MVAREIKGRRPQSGLYRCSSDLRRNSSRVRLEEESCFSRRAWKRLHRTLTGASTLTRMKKGRRSSLSSIDSVWISVVTQRSRHRFVTKSRSSSVLEKVYCLIVVVPLIYGTIRVDFRASFAFASVEPLEGSIGFMFSVSGWR